MRCGSACGTRILLSSSTSSGATSCRPRRTGDSALARAAVSGRPPDPAGAGGDLAPPGPLQAAHGQAARRLHGRAAACAGPRDRHERVGLALVPIRSAPLPPAQRGRMGRRALARRFTFRGRWSVANYATHPYSLNDKQAASLPAEPQALVDGAIAFWGSPTLRPATKALLAFARRAMGDADSKWKQTSYRFLVANACGSSSRSPLTSRPRSDGALLQRLHPRRVAAPRSSRAGPGPARGRSRHAAARRDGARPALVPRPQRRPRARGLRRHVARTSRARGGDRGGSRGRGRSACSSTSSSTAAPTRSRCSSPPPTRCTGSCDRGWRSPSRTARPSPRTAVSAGIRRSRRSRRCTARARCPS